MINCVILVSLITSKEISQINGLVLVKEESMLLEYFWYRRRKLNRPHRSYRTILK